MLGTLPFMAKMPSGPTPAEQALLAIVAGQLAMEGGSLGEPLYEPSPLTVDFVFDDAQPAPLAIELTRLVNPEEMAGGDAMVRHLTDPLNTLAQEEGWGKWLLHVVTPAPYKPLARLAAELIRDDFEIPQGGYTSADLRQAEDDGILDDFVARHRAASDAGIFFLIRTSGDGDAVGVGGQSASMRPMTGFTLPLLNTVYAKEPQLAAARPRQTHLAVEVLRWDYSREANDTMPPPLPEAIDRLWLLHRWADKRGLPNLWWADNHTSQWCRTHAEPIL